MAELIGSDPTELRNLAIQLRSAADEFDGHNARLTGLLGGIEWVGDFASRFLGSWSGGHRIRLQSTSQFIREAAAELDRNADEQQRASDMSGTGGRSGGSPSAAPLGLDDLFDAFPFGPGGEWGPLALGMAGFGPMLGWDLAQHYRTVFANDPVLGLFELREHLSHLNEFAQGKHVLQFVAGQAEWAAVAGRRFPVLSVGLDGLQAVYAAREYGFDRAEFWAPVVSGGGTALAWGVGASGIGASAAAGTAAATGTAAAAAGSVAAPAAAAFGAGMLIGHVINYGSERFTGASVSDRIADVLPAGRDLSRIEAQLHSSSVPLSEADAQRIEDLQGWGALRAMVGL